MYQPQPHPYPYDPRAARPMSAAQEPAPAAAPVPVPIPVPAAHAASPASAAAAAAAIAPQPRFASAHEAAAAAQQQAQAHHAAQVQAHHAAHAHAAAAAHHAYHHHHHQQQQQQQLGSPYHPLQATQHASQPAALIRRSSSSSLPLRPMAAAQAQVQPMPQPIGPEAGGDRGQPANPASCLPPPPVRVTQDSRGSSLASAGGGAGTADEAREAEDPPPASPPAAAAAGQGSGPGGGADLVPSSPARPLRSVSADMDAGEEQQQQQPPGPEPEPGPVPPAAAPEARELAAFLLTLKRRSISPELVEQSSALLTERLWDGGRLHKELAYTAPGPVGEAAGSGGHASSSSGTGRAVLPVPSSSSPPSSSAWTWQRSPPRAMRRCGGPLSPAAALRVSRANQRLGLTVAVPRPRGVPLSMPDDERWLSDHQCYVRQRCVELFVSDGDGSGDCGRGGGGTAAAAAGAGAGPAGNGTGTGSGRRRGSSAAAGTPGRVGIRCAFCRDAVHKAAQSTSFPAKITGLYGAVVMMQCRHFPLCTYMPDDVQEVLEATKPRQGGSGGALGQQDGPSPPRDEDGTGIGAGGGSGRWHAPGRQQYWADAARKMGLVDDPEGGGIRLAPGVDLDGLRREFAGRIRLIASPPVPRDWPAGGTTDTDDDATLEGVGQGGIPVVSFSGSLDSGSQDGSSVVRKDAAAAPEPGSQQGQPVIPADLPDLTQPAHLANLMGDSTIVVPEDKDLVPDYLFLAMAQLAPCNLSDADRVGCYKDRDLGFLGMSCKHCGGQPGFGKYFPATVRSLAQTTTSQTILKHIAVKCRMCPPHIRKAIVALQQTETDAKQKYARGPVLDSDGRPRYGSRKVFFQRVWGRLHGQAIPDVPTEEELAKLNKIHGNGSLANGSGGGRASRGTKRTNKRKSSGGGPSRSVSDESSGGVGRGQLRRRRSTSSASNEEARDDDPSLGNGALPSILFQSMPPKRKRASSIASSEELKAVAMKARAFGLPTVARGIETD